VLKDFFFKDSSRDHETAARLNERKSESEQQKLRAS
jgi:hypothetical protein